MSIRSDLSSYVSNLGTRWNLPEFGISEAIGGATSYSTPGFGSSPAPDYTASTGYPAISMSSMGGSGQAPTTRNQSYAPTQTSSPTGGSGGGGGGQPSGGNPYENIKPSGPSQAEIDSAFNPILDVYNQAESNLRGQQPGLIQEAEAQAQASRGLLGNQRTSANELLGQQEQATQTQQQRQTADQRRILQELQAANQQRFGGASSAGLAASELQGREFQRSQFGIQENAQQALQAIGQQKQQVEREYQQGLQQLEVNRQQAVNEINRRFQDKLLEINARRGETEAAKAQARLEAVQELRNQAFQINVAKAQFEQDLRAQAQANSSYLDQAANQFMSAGQAGTGAYNQFASTTPSGISGVQGSGQQTPGALTGMIGGRPEDQYVGAIGTIPGSSETDPRFQGFVPRQ